MSILYALVCAVLIGGLFGGLITLTTWPDADNRRTPHMGRRDATRRGLIVGAVSAVWAGTVLTVMSVVLT